jgi:hypothetical protein
MNPLLCYLNSLCCDAVRLVSLSFKTLTVVRGIFNLTTFYYVNMWQGLVAV